MEFATVYTAANSADAHLVRARLEAAGFHPFVANEASALNIERGTLAIGGIRVQVPEAEAAEVKEFLETPSTPAE